MPTERTPEQQRQRNIWKKFLLAVALPLVLITIAQVLFPSSSHDAVQYLHPIQHGSSTMLHVQVYPNRGELLLARLILLLETVVLCRLYIRFSAIAIASKQPERFAAKMDRYRRPVKPKPPLRQRTPASWQGNSYNELSSFNDAAPGFWQRYQQIRQQDKSNGW